LAYLIDGHNLIPKMGISLSDLDDEQKLLERLKVFSRLSRKKIEVFFDQAPAGFAKSHRQGNVVTHFIHQGLSADDAIIARLRKLGRAAANWTVVSSDLRVQAEARTFRSSILSSEDFAILVEQVQAMNISGETVAEVSDEEVDEWLKIFRENKSTNS
jgi:predicted RNA-binding protein with PIN domain